MRRLEKPPLDRCLRDRARALRANATPSERALWAALRTNPLGVRFRRQHVLGGFIVDFYCEPARLVVEIDGHQHGREEHRREDLERDAILARSGIAVLRFTNGEVLRAQTGVLERILHAVVRRTSPQ